MEVWYGPDELSTLDQGSSRHLSAVSGAWHTARMLAGKVHIACTGLETRPRRYTGASAWLTRYVRVERHKKE